VSQVYLPRTLAELWSHLDGEPEALVYAGGTDLLVKMRTGKVTAAPVLTCLERLDELRNVGETADTIRIGAAVTHAELIRHPLIVSYLPILVQALHTLGSPLIRNMGTIGGNICTASAAGDTLPPLYILQAEVELCNGETIRNLPIGEFITGPGATQLQKGEILTGVVVKIPVGYNVHHFEKVGQRKSMACAVASMAALLRLSPSGVIEAARLAWGSVGPTVVTAAAVEDALIGEKLSPETLAAAATKIRQLVKPIDDVRATTEYRRAVSGNLLLRLLNTPLVNTSRFTLVGKGQAD
jgi:CO/xanthine dehydrogenase FAD-binding subunit